MCFFEKQLPCALSINVELAKKMRRHYLIATVALAAVGLCLFLFSGNEIAYENDRYPSSDDIEAADKREAPIELAWPAPHTPLAAEPENVPAPPLAEVSEDTSEDDPSKETDPSEKDTGAWKSLRTLGSPERLEVRIVKFLEFNPVDQLRPEQVVGLANSISVCARVSRRPEDIERRHSELYFSGASESDIYFLDEMCEGVTVDHVSEAYQWLLNAAESGDMQAINALIDAVPPEHAQLYFQGAYDSLEFEAINAQYYPKALALLEKSITQGNIRGALKMAYLVYSGVIVEKDDSKSLGYYMAIAAVTGEYKWQHAVELFSKELFTYEIEQAQLFSTQVLKDWASLNAVYF